VQVDPGCRGHGSIPALSVLLRREAIVTGILASRRGSGRHMARFAHPLPLAQLAEGGEWELLYETRRRRYCTLTTAGGAGGAQAATWPGPRTLSLMLTCLVPRGGEWELLYVTGQEALLYADYCRRGGRVARGRDRPAAVRHLRGECFIQ
jgi:hypothetical protein